MDRAEFWPIVAASRKGTENDNSGQSQLHNLEADLQKRAPEEIVEFHRVLDDLMTESYRADLWGAAYLIDGGCSDDGFDYFRHGLISRGKEVYDEALADPDALARHPDIDDVTFEEFSYVSVKVYEAKTGEEPFAFYHRVAEGQKPQGPRTLIGNLGAWTGSDGDMDEAKAKTLYPKLYRRFWD